MGKLDKITFEEQSGEIKDKVQEYWTERADGFFELRHAELESNKAERWLGEISKYIPDGKTIKILDVGCGTGYFEIILGQAGHNITGIDLTEEMIHKANDMISIYKLDKKNVKAIVMDAEKLDFEDETFDMILSRNLTWTLPHPIEAYQEWKRVLKKGGILLNYDAEYAKYAHDVLYNKENFAHQDVSNHLKDACHKIYHMLSISTIDRPEWDKEVLENLGFDRIEINPDYWKYIYQEKDQFYTANKMFSIVARN